MDSGFLAAAAGVAGKLAFTDLHFEGGGVYVVKKTTLIAAMLGLNSVMISRYVRALEKSDSALRVQVVNFATNFLTSVIFSLGFFNEGWTQVQRASWWLGASLMVAGVFVILAKKEKVTRVFCVLHIIHFFYPCTTKSGS